MSAQPAPFDAPETGARFRFPTLLTVTLAVLVLALPARGGQADMKIVPSPNIRALVNRNKPRMGDLDAMAEQRHVRALVAYSKTNYFLDGPRQRGLSYEMLIQFEKFLNKRLETGRFPVHVLFIPVARDELLSKLAQGFGDIAAAGLTVTEDRLQRVDFAAPFSEDVQELLVTGPESRPVDSLKDLSGLEIAVRGSSSYAESLAGLNRRLGENGLPPAKVEQVSEYLETEDILEMVNAGIYKATVADGHIALLWAKTLPHIEIHEGIPLRRGGKVAWAVRKDSPKLKAAIDEFVAGHKLGTYLGNVLFKRYFKNTKWIKRAIGPESLNRFSNTARLIQKYADRYDFDWLMIAALAFQESGLDQSVKSPAGAVGVMQILPTTAAGPPVNIPNIHELEPNIHAGVKYIHHIYNEYYKDEPISPLDRMLFTFASYNAGPARVRQFREKALDMGLDPDTWFNNVEVGAARIVGQETVRYVSNIYKYYLAYVKVQDKLKKKREVLKSLSDS